MKAAPFDYVRPDSLDAALAALADEEPGEARPIAGGQTLVPMMAMRLARPRLLVDLAAVPGLTGIREGDGGLAVGAMTRQRDVERSDLVARLQPLLAKAIRLVGHGQTRARGTVGGSLANADPAAELPLVAVTLDATLHVASANSEREVPAAAFFTGAMETEAAPDELLVEAVFPAAPDGLRTGTGFVEVAMRESDYALVAAAAVVGLDGTGTCRYVALGVGGAAPVPVRLRKAEGLLAGTRLDDADREAAVATVPAALDPEDDVHADAAYRRRVAAILVARALGEALAEARRS